MLNKVTKHRPYFKAQQHQQKKTPNTNPPQTKDLFLVQNITLLLTQGRNIKLFLTSLVTVIFFNSKAKFKFLDAQQLQLTAFLVLCKQSRRIPLAQCPDKRPDSARAAWHANWAHCRQPTQCPGVDAQCESPLCLWWLYFFGNWWSPPYLDHPLHHPFLHCLHPQGRPQPAALVRSGDAALIFNNHSLSPALVSWVSSSFECLSSLQTLNCLMYWETTS